ncbi:MAG: hypothetical protein JO187_02125 [Acidobacteria bacterium]|nr:hypothetical protein [Acidobacteriota bacterium]
MSAEAIARSLNGFLAGSRDAVAVEGGQLLFDFATAKYSIKADNQRCVLHMWSEERNAVRRVLDAEQRPGVLRLTVQRFGQTKPVLLELCHERDRRTPTAKKAARAAYERILRRLLERNFPEFTLAKLATSTDLEHSFGPVYARGLLQRGNTAWAVLGVNSQEPQAAIDASLTFALLLLDFTRAASDRAVVEGLKLFIPSGRSAVVKQRMAHLNRAAAKFELYELEERDQEIQPIDCTDTGNNDTRLVRCANADRARFGASVTRVREIVPEAQTVPLSSTELAFRVNGLEFARARLAAGTGFRNVEEIVFGAGACEITLCDETAEQFADWSRMMAETRRADGPRDHPVWRAQPERWLESLLANNIAALDTRLSPEFVYSQVPAFSSSDRAMIDLLAVTRESRLAVVELKADEDIHLPLQGLDYWARVEWHRSRGEFEKFGYFPGRALAPQTPLLLLVAPALHVHPATDTLLRYLLPEIDCELIGIGERWREELSVIFRKRAPRSPGTAEERNACVARRISQQQ